MEFQATLTFGDLLVGGGTLALATATFIMAKYVRGEAKETKKQAEASVEMAREMKEDRYSRFMPLLFPRIVQVHKRRAEGLPERVTTINTPNELYNSLRVDSAIEWTNDGAGAAVNAQFSLYGVPLDSNPGKVLYFPPQKQTSLGVGDTEPVSFDWEGRWFDLLEGYSPRAIAEYKDIFNRKITTVQTFNIDKDKKEAFLGEIYFEVEGVRLG